MPADFHSEVNEINEGSILHWPTGDNMEITGRIAWKTIMNFRKATRYDRYGIF